MLIGKEVTHEYRGRGVVVAQTANTVTVRFGTDYDLDFPYPAEFNRMLRLRSYDAAAQQQIDADLRSDRLARAEAYRRARKEGRG